MDQARPPRLEDGHTLLLAAMIVHGAYNAAAILINPLFIP
jgi:hypothetical protein